MRAFSFWFVFLGLILVGGAYLQPELQLSEEEAVRYELQQTTNSEDLGNRVNEALEDGDYDSAVMYSEIADFAGFHLPKEAADALYQAGGITATIGRTGSQLASGFFTGEATSLAGLSGAVVSDLTVIGDVRDISREGPKMVAGEPYSELILGLSVVGVGVTGATVATGGGGLPGRIGVTLLKVASKTGSLTVEFSRVLTRMVGDAVNLPGLRQTLREVNLADSAATREAITAYTRTINTAELGPVLARMNDIRGSAGASESVRLMRYVRSTDELADVANMSQRLGRKTRGVIEITGKTSLRAFRTTLRITEWILRNIIAFLSWLGSIFTLFATRFARRLIRSSAH